MRECSVNRFAFIFQILRVSAPATLMRQPTGPIQFAYAFRLMRVKNFSRLIIYHLKITLGFCRHVFPLLCFGSFGAKNENK